MTHVILTFDPRNPTHQANARLSRASQPKKAELSPHLKQLAESIRCEVTKTILILDEVNSAFTRGGVK
jgi:hypothetical protein